MEHNPDKPKAPESKPAQDEVTKGNGNNNFRLTQTTLTIDGHV